MQRNVMVVALMMKRYLIIVETVKSKTVQEIKGCHIVFNVMNFLVNGSKIWIVAIDNDIM